MLQVLIQVVIMNNLIYRVTQGEECTPEDLEAGRSCADWNDGTLHAQDNLRFKHDPIEYAMQAAQLILAAVQIALISARVKDLYQ